MMLALRPNMERLKRDRGIGNALNMARKMAMYDPLLGQNVRVLVYQSRIPRTLENRKPYAPMELEFFHFIELRTLDA